MKIRIKFAKTGCMKFVGHLDTQRFFQMAIRRAKIPVEYTKGFSPHMNMAFAAPLSVGTQSEGEYFDLELTTPSDGINADDFTKDIMESLNSQMVDGILVKAVSILEEGSKNVMASLCAAEYLVYINNIEPQGFDIDGAFNAFISERIELTKKTKTSEKTICLNDHIYKSGIKDGVINLILDASSSGNVNPNLVMEAFMSALPDGVKIRYFVVRAEMFSKKDSGLVALSEYAKHETEVYYV